MAAETNLTELTAVIVASFVSNNPMAAIELPALISTVHATLLRIDALRTGSAAGRTPAVPVEESITRDYMVCINDGQKLRSLKRYINRKYSLSPEEYRSQWGLPDDYPMVAPAYSELRARIAKRQASGPSGRADSPKRDGS
ncbi:MAG: MucR family transcriptional regulator [Inquilinus sp.]|uniref:MucR family transcriptional regulator n=1 Tax=Inquilinus sp. TaxID=1932117 RepID=UPI003F3EED2C